MSSYCRKLEVGGTLMSPNTTDFNTLGSIANYLKTDSKAMVTQILDTLIENDVNNSKIVATEIIENRNLFPPNSAEHLSLSVQSSVWLIKCVYISKSDGSV
jgi:hypothetical protein